MHLWWKPVHAALDWQNITARGTDFLTGHPQTPRASFYDRGRQKITRSSACRMEPQLSIQFWLTHLLCLSSIAEGKRQLRFSLQQETTDNYPCMNAARKSRWIRGAITMKLVSRATAIHMQLWWWRQEICPLFDSLRISRTSRSERNNRDNTLRGVWRREAFFGAFAGGLATVILLVLSVVGASVLIRRSVKITGAL